MPERPKILVVGPHPDDESFFLGGTIAKYARMGVEIHLLVLSNGEKGKISITQGERGSLGTRQIEPSEEQWLAEVRRQECIKAAEVLGIKQEHVEFAGLPNLGINQNAIGVIINSIRRVNPHVIISFDETGTSRPTNQDHSWAGIATYTAIKTLLEEAYGCLELGAVQKIAFLPQFSFRRLLTYNLPKADTFLQEYATLKLPAEDLTLVNVQDFRETKLLACSVHRSQVHLYDYFKSVGLLTLPFEAFYERISLVPSCRGNTDTLFKVDESTSRLTVTVFPEVESKFFSTDPRFYQTIFDHCQVAANQAQSQTLSILSPQGLTDSLGTGKCNLC